MRLPRTLTLAVLAGCASTISLSELRAAPWDSRAILDGRARFEVPAGRPAPVPQLVTSIEGHPVHDAGDLRVVTLSGTAQFGYAPYALVVGVVAMDLADGSEFPKDDALASACASVTPVYVRKGFRVTACTASDSVAGGLPGLTIDLDIPAVEPTTREMWLGAPIRAAEHVVARFLVGRRAVYTLLTVFPFGLADDGDARAVAERLARSFATTEGPPRPLATTGGAGPSVLSALSSPLF